MKLEENLKRIEVIKMFADGGICGEFQGIINYCPMYAIDCPRICTYAKKMEKGNEILERT